MYQRKTKDIYIIIWNNEEIDNATTYQEAKQLKNEYVKAFQDSNIKIKSKRVKNENF